MSNEQLSIYFHNIQGFVSKRSTFLNSNLCKQFDAYVFQETNITTEHVNIDDWDIAGLSTAILTHVDQDNYCRGSILGHIPEITSKQVPVQFPRKFEIAAVKICTSTDSITIISAYKSPSMSSELTIQFFETLCEVINSTSGKMILVGDLNISPGRCFRLNLTEDYFIQMIEQTGLRSVLDKPTRRGVQLDYCFTNHPRVKCTLATEAGVDVLSSNDHDALCIEVDLKLDIVTIPPTLISKSTLSDQTKQQMMRVGLSALFENADSNDEPVDTGRLILEHEILMWEIADCCYHHRIFPEQRRVRHMSRQMSQTVFDTSLTQEQRCEQLEKQRTAEVARRIRKNAKSPRLASALYTLYSQTAKSDQLLNCKIDPEEFAKQILDDEKEANHESHPRRHQMPNITRSKEEILEAGLLGRLRSKWREKPMFVEAFWQHITLTAFTPTDRGCYTFNSVETVVKDKKQLDKAKGWRLVWKTPSISEKTMDLIRASHVNCDELHNDAYCGGKSTQRTLGLVHAWRVDRGHGLLGIDFKNAFALACRKCANNLFGHELMNEMIEFSVCVDGRRSKEYTSTNGTGAGRATGGPGFNICFQQVVDKLVSVLPRGDICPYADDSQLKIKLCGDMIGKAIKCFDEATDIGLTMHAHGKKGPTLLTSKGDDKIKASRMVSEIERATVAVVNEIKFLGLNLTIDGPTRYVKSGLTTKSKQTLGFYANEMTRTLRKYYAATPQLHRGNDIYKIISQSISTFIESRIQYVICFADAETLAFCFNIHKKAICAILGVPQTIFGFKWITSGPQYVVDLYDALDKLCSPTYTRLCALAGKPTLLGIAFRAATVVNSQMREECARPRPSRFSLKILSFLDRYTKSGLLSHDKPADNIQHRSLMSLTTIKERRIFTRMATDCLLLGHLESKGFDVQNTCRICGQAQETLAHVMSHLPGAQKLPAGVRRSLMKLKRMEAKFHPMADNRVRLMPDNDVSKLFTSLFSHVHVSNFVQYRSLPNPRKRVGQAAPSLATRAGRVAPPAQKRHLPGV